MKWYWSTHSNELINIEKFIKILIDEGMSGWLIQGILYTGDIITLATFNSKEEAILYLQNKFLNETQI